ncbi:hypothetical protein LPW11_15235 [Geomonas sp. RF6]|uniref:hypothetical protein n=1 Tax=Geomonas sp. RF6 TaxID=2897342 RepID=UPI001E2C3DED|nr:hypothetical protein [Geomonas sp. RF6]UFS69245.1 hypothetical protein LPW11_15235 [Geomonas sp. RF6]
MRRGGSVAEHLVRSLLLLALATAPVRGEEPAELPPEPAGADERAAVGEERHVETLEQKGGSIGYRSVFREDNPSRALPYSYLHSSAAGTLFYRRLEADSNIEVEGAFLNRNDYNGDLLLDYRGDYRLHLRTESLYHNLDRELLFTPDFILDSNDPTTGNRARYHANQDAEQGYGISVTQDLAQFRYRLHNFPLHANFGYWRLIREGTIQQRFADTSFEGTGGALASGAENNVFAEARAVDQRTEEGSVSLDSHLGPVDLIYAFKVRQFEDREPIPTHDYLSRTGTDGMTVDRFGGVQEHNENPDSRLYSHTVKAHTSLAGGLAATGSYTFERRENLSRLTDTAGVKHATVDVQGGAGDVTYTPCKEFTLSVKYRHQELDHDGPAALSNSFFTTSQPLRPGVDTVKDQVTALLSYRLSRTATVNGEYRGDFLSREQVAPTPSALYFALPEHSNTQRGTLSFIYRPKRGARLNARYSYSTTDHPSYGASFAERHEGELLASYTSGSRWGATAGVRERRDSNDEVQRFLLNYPFDPISYSTAPPISRSRESRSANLAVWVAPLARTTVSAHYSYLENSVDQGVFFTGIGSGSEAFANYFNRAHVYALNGTYGASETLDLQLMLQQVRSHAAFRPQIVAFSATSDTSGVRELTEQETTISTLSARAEKRFTERLSGSLEYSLNDYHEGTPPYSTYNGTVHAVAAYLSARW